MVNRDFSLANYVIWSGKEFTDNPAGRIYVVCDTCGYERFNIKDSVKHVVNGNIKHNLFIAQCMQCGTVYDVNINKVKIK